MTEHTVSRPTTTNYRIILPTPWGNVVLELGSLPGLIAVLTLVGICFLGWADKLPDFKLSPKQTEKKEVAPEPPNPTEPSAAVTTPEGVVSLTLTPILIDLPVRNTDKKAKKPTVTVPAPTVEAKRFRVIDSTGSFTYVPFRRGPGLKMETMDELAPGTTGLIATGKERRVMEDDGRSAVWVEIIYLEKTGWVAKAYIKKDSKKNQ